MTDLERINKLLALHTGDDFYVCRKCRTLPATGSCDTQYAIQIAFRLLQHVAELDSPTPASADPPSE